ncbi:hypothetical protein WJX73_008686 [Symbiochloris irregularis]|uniref:Uncharacterized protein n=1 Tax=Symbiochloris irregularis TaxID=706552 RepID=A0AAW1P3I6_9CHLO
MGRTGKASDHGNASSKKGTPPQIFTVSDDDDKPQRKAAVSKTGPSTQKQLKVAVAPMKNTSRRLTKAEKAKKPQELPEFLQITPNGEKKFGIRKSRLPGSLDIIFDNAQEDMRGVMESFGSSIFKTSKTKCWGIKSDMKNAVVAKLTGTPCCATMIEMADA